MEIECDEMYKIHCSERFNRIDEKQDEVLRILKGPNGKRGVCEQVRLNTRFNKALMGIVVFLASLILIQAAIWIREEISSDTKRTDIEQRQETKKTRN